MPQPPRLVQFFTAEEAIRPYVRALLHQPELSDELLIARSAALIKCGFTTLRDMLLERQASPNDVNELLHTIYGFMHRQFCGTAHMIAGEEHDDAGDEAM